MGPCTCIFRVFFDQVRVNVAADSSTEIAPMSIAGTFNFTEVALLECSESRLSKKLRNKLPKDGKATMTKTELTGSERFKQT